MTRSRGITSTRIGAGVRLWLRLVVAVAVVVAVSFRQVIRWQADLDPDADPLLTIEVQEGRWRSLTQVNRFVQAK